MMLVELWLATTWFLYSYNPTANQPQVVNSQCLPSCLMADSLLGNIMASGEADESLNGLKCSFLSFLTETCWSHPDHVHCDATNDVTPSTSTPASRQQLTDWYNGHCSGDASKSCFAIFSRKNSILGTNSKNQTRTSKCAAEYESLLKELLRNSCSLSADEIDERDNKIRRFKSCASHEADAKCRRQVNRFIDTFTDHIKNSSNNNCRRQNN